MNFNMTLIWKYITSQIFAGVESYPRGPKRLKHLVIKPIEHEDHTTDLNPDFRLLRRIIVRLLMSLRRGKYRRPRRNITR